MDICLMVYLLYYYETANLRPFFSSRNPKSWRVAAHSFLKVYITLEFYVSHPLFIPRKVMVVQYNDLLFILFDI